MIQLFYLPPVVLILILSLLSCTGIDDKPVETVLTASPVTDTRFAAWQPSNTSANSPTASQAVKQLLEQADVLMSKNLLQQATDKLERLVRIEPTYAQAWSRLAWIALQLDAPERGRQMAQRSNSYAYDNNKLKVLNWQFIRHASVLLNDATAVDKADAIIKKLGGEV